ncbi:glycoside hydrolase, partial [candidate division WOR-3 bacterium]|nr:glycoside hydrolase [candidate division WOR-3 bacterium]
MKKYLIIHGHFYQPPRENPWIEEVGKELPAYPYHNWNERITAECYSPNLNAIVLDSEKNLLDVINNFQIISFNFGPTLLSWMEENATEIYSRILSSDRDNAIAQVYNHIIMPLALRRDMRTEVLWGIKDFEHRFGRNPKGMWLPETAVSNEALEVLAECGIEFTILAPHQIGRIKKINEKKWEKKEEKEKTSGMFL